MLARIARWWSGFWPPLPVWKRLDMSVFAVGVYGLVVELIVEWVFPPNAKPPKWMGELAVVNAVFDEQPFAMNV